MTALFFHVLDELRDGASAVLIGVIAVVLWLMGGANVLVLPECRAVTTRWAEITR